MTEPSGSDALLREAAKRFLDTHPCASDGNLCSDQAHLRAALDATNEPEARASDMERAITIGTHEPAVDDFGHQYLARVSASVDMVAEPRAGRRS